ncbi:Outer membrane protein assembly factor BamE [Buchnera aphidicola (Protaphis terricola)]|uniref:outer membrane protein assembly factor BamE domain-containing protein n=1 Tax=Buchnera aphidicola TaxID=9 RepID=UPI003464A736
MSIRIFILLLITFLCTSCSFLKGQNYSSEEYYSDDMNEFYMNLKNFKKKYKGMTREQIIYIFGYPIISDTFSDSYHYIFYKKCKISRCKKEILNIFFNNDKVIDFNIRELENF